MQLIDTHVHINFDVFETELETLRERWREVGVVKLVHSCVKPQEFSSIQAIADRFPEVFFSVGLHPLDCHEWTEETAREILSLANSDSRVVAIGETGLDFYKADNQAQQIAAFQAQLEIALMLNKPVIIHCREAASTTAEVLQKFMRERGKVQGVMHCWGGTPEEMAWFLDLGFYISFSGTVTFNKAKPIQESAVKVNSDRLLIETDCPFLAPVPRRGKRNEPAFVLHVAEQLARLRGVDLPTIARQSTQNAAELFSLNMS